MITLNKEEINRGMRRLKIAKEIEVIEEKYNILFIKYEYGDGLSTYCKEE